MPIEPGHIREVHQVATGWKRREKGRETGAIFPEAGLLRRVLSYVGVRRIPKEPRVHQTTNHRKSRLQRLRQWRQDVMPVDLEAGRRRQALSRDDAQQLRHLRPIHGSAKQ